MNAMKKWLLAGLIGVSMGGAQASTIIDDFNNNQAFDTVGGTFSSYWTWNPNSPLDNGQTHVPLTSPSTANVVRELIATSGAVASGGISGDKWAIQLQPTDPNGGGHMIVEYYLPTAISLAETESFVLKGTGSYSSDPLGQGNNYVGWGMFFYSGYNPGNGEYSAGATVSAEFTGTSGVLGDISASYADISALGVDMNSINLISIWFYAYGDTDTGDYNATINYTADRFGIGPLQNDPPVPEPETVWMIVAVLASLGVTFRRQLTSLFVKA